MNFDDVLAAVDRACRDEHIPMLGPHKAARLAELVRAARPRLVVECGTAIGYSGLWIARELMQLGAGRLVTFEKESARAMRAAKHFSQAGVDQLVELHVASAEESRQRVAEPVDFLFIDCGWANYGPVFEHWRAALRPGALVVADNVGVGAGEMRDYLELVRREYPSRTEWFDLDLPWSTRDAMEITQYRPKNEP